MMMMHPQHGCYVQHTRATRTSFPRLGSRLSQRARWERATTCCLHSHWCLRPQVFYHHKYQVLCQLYFSMRKSYLVMSQLLWTRSILYTPKIQLSEVHTCCFDSHWYISYLIIHYHSYIHTWYSFRNFANTELIFHASAMGHCMLSILCVLPSSL